MSLYDDIAQADEKMRKGMVYCHQCGASMKVDSATCLQYGWPKCCGYTMSLDAPAEAESEVTE